MHFAEGSTRLIERSNGRRDRGHSKVTPRGYYPRIEQLEARQLLDCVVSNNNNTGIGSFRNTIILANNGQCDSRITFNIVGGGVQVISPTSDFLLPAINNAPGLLIDATTQPRKPGDTGTSPIVVLNGQFAGTGVGAIGLRIETQGVTVKGLAIVGFDNVGIFITGTGAKDNRVLNSYIGVDHTGQAKVGNGTGVSIALGASGNYIGGVPGDQVSCPTDDKQRTIISGNKQDGVHILSAVKNVICNTYIGLAKDGSTSLGNGYAGVNLGPDSSENRIGGRVFTDLGTIISPANVISANGTSGLRIEGPGGGKNYVNGNFIGTNSAGTLARGNSTDGIEVIHSPDNLVGGPAFPGDRNVISGNGVGAASLSKHGVSVFGTGAVRNQILGNYIGTRKNGDQTNPIPNQGKGIWFEGGAIQNKNQVRGNTVAFNMQGGVYLAADAGTGITISGNSTFLNQALGIDLNNDSVTVNDADDADPGPNSLQNYPDLTLAVQSATGGGGLSVEFTIYLSEVGDYVFEFFDNLQCDDSTYGEGEKFLGSMTFSVAVPGLYENLFFLLPDAVPPPDPPISYYNITATATDPDGSTSEFSNCLGVQTEGGSLLSGLSPNSGPTLGGNEVMIVGDNFLGTRQVMFGNNASRFRVVSRRQLVATAPPGILGTVDVRVSNPRGTSPIVPGGRYTYTGGDSPGGGSPGGRFRMDPWSIAEIGKMPPTLLPDIPRVPALLLPARLPGQLAGIVAEQGRLPVTLPSWDDLPVPAEPEPMERSFSAAAYGHGPQQPELPALDLLSLAGPTALPLPPALARDVLERLFGHAG